MSSRAKKVRSSIIAERLSTVTSVLAVVESEASRMNWWQRFKLANDFLWKKNIHALFEIAESNEEKKNDKKVQDTRKKG